MSPTRDTSYEYSSQLDVKFDQVEIKRHLGGKIKGKFYIGVYSHVRTSFQL
jgi:hypothetical protein